MPTSNSHQKSVLAVLYRRLQERELQAAKFGPAADPLIKLEIEDIKLQIASIQDTDYRINEVIQINLHKLLETYKLKNPLLTGEALLSKIDFNSWSSAQVGIFSSAPRINFYSRELLIDEIDRNYLVYISFGCQIEEKYLLTISTPTKNKSFLIRSFENQGSSVITTFFENTQRTSIVADSVEDIICPLCNNTSRSCESCQGETMTKFQVYCVCVQPKIFHISQFKLFNKKEEEGEEEMFFPEDNLDLIFEGDVFDKIPHKPNLIIDGVSKRYISELPLKYGHIKRHIENKISSNIIEEPDKVFDFNQKNMIREWSVLSSEILTNGYKFFVTSVPIYRLYYRRSSDFRKGIFKKTDFVAHIHGEAFLYGSKEIKTARQWERAHTQKR